MSHHKSQVGKQEQQYTSRKIKPACASEIVEHYTTPPAAPLKTFLDRQYSVKVGHTYHHNSISSRTRTVHHQLKKPSTYPDKLGATNKLSPTRTH